MSIKIPDSPNIIGGSAVLRETQSIRGPEVVDMSMDTKPLQDFVANAGEAYSKYLEDREKTEDQARYNGWVEHMTAYRVRLYDENQRGKAKDLYKKIEEESNRYITDTTKNLPTSATNRMKDWVASQMPGYMSSAANYEAQQNAIYRQEVNETAIARNAQVISTSDNPIEIQIARDNIEYSVRDTLRGSPESLIASTIAMQQDQASVAMISNTMLKDPVRAAALLNGDELASSVRAYLSQDSIAKCRKALIESAQAQLINEYAAYEYSGKGTAAPIDAEMVRSIIGENATEAQVEWFMAEVKSQGHKKADAMKQEMVGVQNQLRTTLTEQITNAETFEQQRQAVQNMVLAGQLDESEANALYESLNNNQYFAALQASVAPTVDMIVKRTGSYDIDSLIDNYETYYTGVGDFVVHDAMSIADQEKYDELTKKIQERESILSKREDNLALIGAAGKGIETPDVELMKLKMQRDKLVVKEDEPIYIPEEEMQKLRQYKEEMDKRFSGAENVPELIRKVSTGEIQGYDVQEFAQVGYGYHEMLLNISRVENEYRQASKEMKKAGVNLDGIIGDIDAIYKNLDPTAASTVKRSVLQQINAWKKKNGDYPPEDTIKEYSLKARAGALSKEAVAVQKLADKYSDTMDTLDMQINESLSKRIKYKEYKTSDRSYEKSVARAETLLDDIADDLSRTHKNWIESKKESLIPLVMSGRWDLLTLQLKSIPGSK